MTQTQKPARTAAATLNVTAQDYSYTGLPATISAGAKLNFNNNSTKEAHELVAFKLADTEKRSAGEIFRLPEAELDTVLAGPPVTVIVAPPGQAGMVVLGDGTLKDKGRYVFACFIPKGADPAAYMAAAQAAGKNPQAGPPQVPGGPPHFTQGMFAEATVT